jgi:flavodoxin
MGYMKMKTLIIYTSIHHGNTKKIAKSIAGILDAELVKPTKVNISNLSEYNMIGFGSGIYYGKHHKGLLKLVDNFPTFQGKKSFIFSTSGVSNAGNIFHNIRLRISHFHVPLRRILLNKGFDVVGEFDCRGFDTIGPLKAIGGISKCRPDKKDLKNAESFAINLKKIYG